MLTGPVIIAVIAFGGLWLRRRLSSWGMGRRRHAGPLLPRRRLAEQAAPGGPTAYRPRPGEPVYHIQADHLVRSRSRLRLASPAELGPLLALGDPLRMVPA
jgi:hypothetical protein